MTATLRPPGALGAGHGEGADPGRPPRGLRAAIAIVATALVLGATALPLWQAELVAPQYPENLRLLAYGHGVEGDVEEIDLLNHYVGMRPFDPADVPEMALWPLAVGAAILAVAVSALAGRRVVGRLARLYLWGLPLGVLGAIQLRLHQYGHDLDPSAALRIPEFTPWVIGRTTVMNFATWAWPGAGLALLVAAAALVTFGLRLASRWSVTGRAAGAVLAVALIGISGPAWSMSPALAHAGHDDDAAQETSQDAPATGHEGHGSAGGGDEAGGERPAPGGSAGPSRPPAEAAPSTSGPARDLAALLETVEEGDRVSLAPGRWQGPVTIDVPIELHGLGRAVIEGDGTGSVVVVRAPGTTITGVTVRGSGPGPTGDPAGIRVEADDVRVEDVVVQDSYIGLAVAGAAGAHLVGNTVHGRSGEPVAEESHALAHDGDEEHGPAAVGAGGRGDSVSLWDAEGVLVRDNHIHGGRDGIYVSFGSGALLDRNHVEGSRYAVHSMFAEDLTLAENHFEGNLSGAVLMYGGPALLLRNEIADHRSAATGFGVLLKDIDGVEATENIVTGNRVGLHLDGSEQTAEPNRVRANTVAGNDLGVALVPAATARLSANSFVANKVQVGLQGGGASRAEWVEDGWGNYWDTYRGHEGGIAGLGAVPHAEGGRVDTLLQRAPALTAIASSPGVRMLRELERRWAAGAPAIVDELPLTRPVSPSLPSAPTDPSAAPTVAALSALLLLACAGALVAFRRLPSAKELP